MIKLTELPKNLEKQLPTELQIIRKFCFKEEIKNVKQRKEKIIYSDNGVDKAITGIIQNEDDFFYNILGDNGRNYQVGKRAIILIKDIGGCSDGRD